MDKKYKKYKPQNFFQRNFSFAGTVSRGEFWSDVGVRLISWLCAAVMLGMLFSVTIPADTQTVTNITEIAAIVLGAIWFVSIVAMSRRRLRDAGLGAKSYLWLLLPVIGWIVFIGMLCRKTAISEK